MRIFFNTYPIKAHCGPDFSIDAIECRNCISINAINCCNGISINTIILTSSAPASETRNNNYIVSTKHRSGLVDPAAHVMEACITLVKFAFPSMFRCTDTKMLG